MEMFKKYWWVLGLGVGVWLWSRAATASKGLNDLAVAVAAKFAGLPVSNVTAVQDPDGTVRVIGTYGGNTGYTFITASSLAEAWQKSQLLSPQNPVQGFAGMFGRRR